MARLPAFLLISVLLLAACDSSAPAPVVSAPSAPPVNSTAYYDCIKRGADSGVRSAAKDQSDFVKVDLDHIAREVLGYCANLFSNGTPLDYTDLEYTRTSAQQVLNLLPHQDQRRKQAELDRHKMQAESDAARSRYLDCLFAHTRVLALRSSEPAATVVHAAFTSCAKERATILGEHRGYQDTLINEDVLKAADDKVVPSLLLEAIRVRVTPAPSAPSPPPRPASDDG